jgi:hypothetical protein
MPHFYAIKPANCKSTLIYVDLVSNSKTTHQSTFDIALAKIGGVRQILMLTAKVNLI